MSTNGKKAAPRSGEADGLCERIEVNKKRRAELQEQLNEAAKQVAEAELALAGGVGDMSDVEVYRLRRQVLQGTADRVDQQLMKLRARRDEIKDGLETEQGREATLEKLADLAERAARLRERERECKETLARTLEEGAREHLQVSRERGEIAQQFRHTACALEEEPEALCNLLQARGVDLGGILRRPGGTGSEWPSLPSQEPDLGIWAGTVNEVCARASKPPEATAGLTDLSAARRDGHG